MSTENPWQAPQSGPSSSAHENGSAPKPRTRGYVVIAVLALCSLIPPLTIVGLACIICGAWVWLGSYQRELEMRRQGHVPRPIPLGPVAKILVVPGALAAGGAVMLGTCNVTFWGGWVPLSFLDWSGPGNHLGPAMPLIMVGTLMGVIAGLIAAGYLLVRTNQRPLQAEQENEIVARSSNARIVMPMESTPVNPVPAKTSPEDPGGSTG